MLDWARIHFYLKLSRPILWLGVLPYYLFPLGGRLDLLATWRFWLGLLFFTFPVNIMMFGINDMADTDVDKYNPTKSINYYGNQATESELVGLWGVILVSHLIPLFIMSVFTADWIFYPLFFVGNLSLHILYNLKPFAFARKAPWDLPLVPSGFLLLVSLSCHLNQVPLPKAGPCLFYIAFSLTSHMLAELSDIDYDAPYGKRTTAVAIGKVYTCLFIAALILVQFLALAPLANPYVAMVPCGADVFNLVPYIYRTFLSTSQSSKPWEGSRSFLPAMYARYLVRLSFVAYAFISGVLA
ncbi:hypothetical protein FOZ63_014705 [Perkinsus olseni]|uniref:UbiA prenyltransferase domain-containing protein 1 n=1 Tax=Perkinsus olseni TaxID=32597 RepID=A0A7J6RG03_PEROL|nr:hypothetical protein FOZ63_014705 [Perkinsus olseni]KAF4719563.1 hypothetical protein FOZ62_010687 [Perkinsus olseni]